MIVRALWLNGTVGVGKTTVGAEVANQLATAGDPVAFVDIDALGDLSPRPPDDPLNTRLVAKNLKSAHEELHAEKERIAGDPGLTPAGREQARLTAAAVAGFAVPVALYSNPLKRASETAAPSANRLALAIQYDDRLRERLNWDGDRPVESFLADWEHTTKDRDFMPPFGDSSHRAAERMLEALADIASRRRGEVVVVTHGGVTVDLLRTLLGEEAVSSTAPDLLTAGVPSCALTTLTRLGDAWSVDRIASVEHLADQRSDP